jgi:uncharacterized membrane protein YhaH (DUF805 family)
MPVDPTDPDLPLYGASPLTAYARFWRRYFVFTGRAGLAEYWWTVLLNTVVGVVLVLVGGILVAVGGAMSAQGSAVAAVPNSLGAVLLFAAAVFFLAQLVPSIAVTVRRLHDANLSGLLYLLSLIPSAGGIIVLILTVLPANPAGRRFDRGAGPLPTAPWDAAPTPSAALPASPSAAPFDAWPAPGSAPPATAPMPVLRPADPGLPPDDALLAAWGGLGEVERVTPALGGQPSWRTLGYLHVRTADGVDVLATNGLGEAEGAVALGAGAEVYLPGRDLGATPEAVAHDWRFAVVAAVARRIGASGMHLPAELEQYGALSMSVPADAPEGWRTDDGGVGVLVGVGLPDVPEAVATAAGEVRLVGLALLRPEELQRILVGGREVRATIASRLASLPPAQLLAPDRPAV